MNNRGELERRGGGESDGDTWKTLRSLVCGFSSPMNPDEELWGVCVLGFMEEETIIRLWFLITNISR